MVRQGGPRLPEQGIHPRPFALNIVKPTKHVRQLCSGWPGISLSLLVLRVAQAGAPTSSCSSVGFFLSSLLSGRSRRAAAAIRNGGAAPPASAPRSPNRRRTGHERTRAVRRFRHQNGSVEHDRGRRETRGPSTQTLESGDEHGVPALVCKRARKVGRYDGVGSGQRYSEACMAVRLHLGGVYRNEADRES